MRIRHADDANKTDGHRLSLLYINKLSVTICFITEFCIPMFKGCHTIPPIEIKKNLLHRRPPLKTTINKLGYLDSNQE